VKVPVGTRWGRLQAAIFAFANSLLVFLLSLLQTVVRRGGARWPGPARTAAAWLGLAAAAAAVTHLRWVKCACGHGMGTPAGSNPHL
jgi:hypothetical protein